VPADTILSTDPGLIAAILINSEIIVCFALVGAIRKRVLG
jgi:hypothetical protein